MMLFTLMKKIDMYRKKIGSIYIHDYECTGNPVLCLSHPTEKNDNALLSIDIISIQ